MRAGSGRMRELWVAALPRVALAHVSCFQQFAARTVRNANFFFELKHV